MDLFQRMVVDAVARVIGPMAEVLVRRVCRAIGTDLDALKPFHMDAFSTEFISQAKGLTDERRIQAAAGVLKQFKNSKIGEFEVAG